MIIILNMGFQFEFFFKIQFDKEMKSQYEKNDQNC